METADIFFKTNKGNRIKMLDSIICQEIKP